MSTKRSVEEILGSLESRAAFLREREAFHAAQEAHHREQRAVHAVELETVLQHLAAFRDAAGPAIEMSGRPLPQGNPAAGRTSHARKNGLPMVSRVIRSLVESQPEGVSFGASAIAEEANRRFGDTLGRPVDTRAASDVLRRMKVEGRLHLVRAGKAFYEAQYARGRKAENKKERSEGRQG